MHHTNPEGLSLLSLYTESYYPIVYSPINTHLVLLLFLMYLNLVVIGFSLNAMNLFSTSQLIFIQR